jgi:hypothetical protein
MGRVQSEAFGAAVATELKCMDGCMCWCAVTMSTVIRVFCCLAVLDDVSLPSLALRNAIASRARLC